MSEDEFVNDFDEYTVAESNFIEMAQEASHLVRVKVASAEELLEQYEMKKAELEFAISQLKKSIGAVQ